MQKNTPNYNSNIHFWPLWALGGALGGPKSSRGGGRAFLTPSGTFFWLPWPSLGHKNTVRVLVKLVYDNPHLSPHPTIENNLDNNI